MNTWLEVKDAVNKIYKKHSIGMSPTDVVADFYNNNLPLAIEHVLVMECVENNRDELTEIVINGYKQLQEKGYIWDPYKKGE